MVRFLLLSSAYPETSMMPRELNEYRISLQNKRAELSYGNRRHGILDIEPTADEMDQTREGQERDLAVGTCNRDAKLLSDVRSALGRIEEGTFGMCLDCEGDIGGKRLAAAPWAASCLACQEAADSVAGQPWSRTAESFVNAVNLIHAA